MSETIDRVVAAIWHLTTQQQEQDEIAKKAQAEIKRLEKQIRSLQKVLKTEERMITEAQRALDALRAEPEESPLTKEEEEEFARLDRRDQIKKMVEIGMIDPETAEDHFLAGSHF